MPDPTFVASCDPETGDALVGTLDGEEMFLRLKGRWMSIEDSPVPVTGETTSDWLAVEGREGEELLAEARKALSSSPPTSS